MSEDAKKVLVTEELERVKIVNNSGTLYIKVHSGLKAEYGLRGGDELIYARHIASGRLVLLVGEPKENNVD